MNQPKKLKRVISDEWGNPNKQLPKTYFGYPLKFFVFIGILLGSLTLVSLYDLYEDSFGGSKKFTPASHRLALGTAAMVDRTDITSIEPLEITPANFQTVLQQRIATVNKDLQLVQGNYKPSESVFSRVDSSLGWLSIVSFYYEGRTPHSTEGASYESLGILNPFQLIIPEFTGLTTINNNILWIKNKVDAQRIINPAFRFNPKLKSLNYFPRLKYAEASYNLSGFTQHLNPFIAKPVSPATIFNFTAYNAADFGFQSIQILPNESMNIKLSATTNDPIFLDEYLHARKGLCDEKKKCNHRSETNVLFDNITIQNLPAKLVVGLWWDAPKNSGTSIALHEDLPSDKTQPDFRYIINLS